MLLSDWSPLIPWSSPEEMSVPMPLSEILVFNVLNASSSPNENTNLMGYISLSTDGILKYLQNQIIN